MPQRCKDVIKGRGALIGRERLTQAQERGLEVPDTQEKDLDDAEFEWDKDWQADQDQFEA